MGGGELLGPELADAARRVGSQLTVNRYQSAVEEVEPVSDGWAFHGAFPVWSGMSCCLYWADALAPAVHCFDGKQDRIIAGLNAPITAMLLGGDTLIVVHDGHYVRLEADGHVSLPVAAPTGLAFVPEADGPALYVTSDLARRAHCKRSRPFPTFMPGTPHVARARHDPQAGVIHLRNNWPSMHCPLEDWVAPVIMQQRATER